MIPIDALLEAEGVISLAHPLTASMPLPGHASFEYELLTPHADDPPVPGADERISGATDRFGMGIHSGTHIDSLTHVAFEGRTFDGTEVRAPGVQGPSGIAARSAVLRPIVSGGVLLDFTSFFGVPVVPADTVIDAAAMVACAAASGVDVRAGDTVLVRTGWDTLWADPSQYLAPALPGPDLSAARWLREGGVVAAGSDTMTFEAMGPGIPPMDVHVELLVRGGIFILENLDLRALAAIEPGRFAFVVAPLPLDSATGSPVNPLAVVGGQGRDAVART